MSRIVLAEAYRTPIGVFGGVFKDIPAYELGATVIRQILEHSQIDPNEINEVILGNVLQAGQDKILLVLLRFMVVCQKRYLLLL